jgi:6-phosphogluconolactonase
MKMDTRIFPDLEALSRGALEELLRILHEAVGQRGRFALALAGGRTPAKMYELWAREEKYRSQTPWERVHFFWGDERYVPPDDPLSNYRMARETLLSQVPIPENNIHRMPTSFPDPNQAAAAYEAELKDYFGSAPPAFDVQLLGLGPEGHTASLFPGSPALEERRWVVAVEVAAKPPRRLTLTLPVLNLGRNTFFQVAGADKQEILAALRADPDSGVSEYPAARVRPDGPVLWFLDRAAAAT